MSVFWGSNTNPDTTVSSPVTDDHRLIAALRSGEERAFTTLLDQYQTAMMSLATFYVSSHAVAEEVVQETWIGVIQGIERFEGRSSLKTWIFRILSNRARTRGAREGRYIPFSAFRHARYDTPEFSGGLEACLSSGYAWCSHHGSAHNARATVPEDCLVSKEMVTGIQEAIAALPINQRTVITLRDVEGWTAEEVCHFLDISGTNQRVLLHRARANVRRKLEQWLIEG